MLRSINNLELKKEQRKKLRQLSTPAETKLWDKLRGRRLNGHKFYRQFSVGMFILDFYCHEKKLAIELDGELHKQRETEDFSRSIYLENQGITVIRFWNHEVMADVQKVCEQIIDAIR
jgi:very-short-patch-repair endonuclease